MAVPRTKVAAFPPLDISGPQEWAPVVEWVKCINNNKKPVKKYISIRHMKHIQFNQDAEKQNLK